MRLQNKNMFIEEGNTGKIWPMRGLRNCDVRQVLCILTIFCHFKPKNVCIFFKILEFSVVQSEIILVKCCKEVIVPLVSIFLNFPCLSRNIFVQVCVHSSYGLKFIRKLPTFSILLWWHHVQPFIVLPVVKLSLSRLLRNTKACYDVGSVVEVNLIADTAMGGFSGGWGGGV